MHWSAMRWDPSVSSQQTVYGTYKSSVELIALTVMLLDSGKGEGGFVAGVRFWSVVRRFKGFAADMLATPRIEQKRSAIAR